MASPMTVSKSFAAVLANLLAIVQLICFPVMLWGLVMPSRTVQGINLIVWGIACIAVLVIDEVYKFRHNMRPLTWIAAIAGVVYLVMGCMLLSLPS